MDNLMQTFITFQDSLDSEQIIREKIKTTTKEIEEKTRKIITLLQIIHQEDALPKISSTCDTCNCIIQEIKSDYVELAKQVEPGMYFKFYDYWKMVTQKLCFVIALIYYLEKNTLVSRNEVASVLGLAVNEKDGFHLPVEDYLFGLLTLVNELSRYAVNAVTNGDYEKPIKISHFVSEIDAGFRLLNLKNDGLRKRYDALKYDVKKIEEVVYDLSIRGLRNKDSVPTVS